MDQLDKLTFAVADYISAVTTFMTQTAAQRESYNLLSAEVDSLRGTVAAMTDKFSALEASIRNAMAQLP
jgi:hypothetical protein